MTDRDVAGEIDELDRQLARLMSAAEGITAGIDGLKARSNTHSKGLRTPLDRSDYAAEHLRQHRPGPPSKIDGDPEMLVFILARIDTMTFRALARAVAKEFPPERRVKRSIINDWWHRRGRPSLETHPRW